MGTIFISHSSKDNEAAIKVRDWLKENGWPDVFLDLDPESGLKPGERWQDELRKAGERCSAVLLLISPNWARSKWCQVEFHVAEQLGKLIFPLVIEPTPFDELDTSVKSKFQLADISTPEKEEDGFDRLHIALQQAGLTPNSFPWPPENDPHRSPYRGLQALTESDAAVFFGREAVITRGMDTLRRMRDGAPEKILSIQGASGAGKSSFLRAGLIARLKRDRSNFLVLSPMRPEIAAVSGKAGLISTLGLSPALAGQPNLVAELKRAIGERQNEVLSELTRLAIAGGESAPQEKPTVILPVDQFEEVFSTNQTEAREFLDTIAQLLAGIADLRVILTVRSDSAGLLQNEERLSETSIAPLYLSAMPPGAFKEIIEGPGRLAEPPIVFEPALTECLLADLGQADALPLMAMTLDELVRSHQRSGPLTLSKYRDEYGGLDGAVEHAADNAMRAARKDSRISSQNISVEELARGAFIPALVEIPHELAAPHRRQANLSDFSPQTLPVIEHLVDHRILVMETRDDGTTVVEVAHEAVLRRWRSLASWIDQERGALQALGGLRSAADEWAERSTQRDREDWLVHGGDRLVEAERIAKRSDFTNTLTETHHAYLKACRDREDAAQRRKAKQRRQVTSLAFLVLATAIALAATSVSMMRSANITVSNLLTERAGYFDDPDVRLPYSGNQALMLATRNGPLTPVAPQAERALRGVALAIDNQSSTVNNTVFHTVRFLGNGRIAAHVEPDRRGDYPDQAQLVVWEQNEPSPIYQSDIGTYGFERFDTYLAFGGEGAIIRTQSELIIVPSFEHGDELSLRQACESCIFGHDTDREEVMFAVESADAQTTSVSRVNRHGETQSIGLGAPQSELNQRVLDIQFDNGSAYILVGSSNTDWTDQTNGFLELVEISNSFELVGRRTLDSGCRLYRRGVIHMRSSMISVECDGEQTIFYTLSSSGESAEIDRFPATESCPVEVNSGQFYWTHRPAGQEWSDLQNDLLIVEPGTEQYHSVEDVRYIASDHEVIRSLPTAGGRGFSWCSPLRLGREHRIVDISRPKPVTQSHTTILISGASRNFYNSEANTWSGTLGFHPSITIHNSQQGITSLSLDEEIPPNFAGRIGIDLESVHWSNRFIRGSLANAGRYEESNFLPAYFAWLQGLLPSEFSRHLRIPDNSGRLTAGSDDEFRSISEIFEINGFDALPTIILRSRAFNADNGRPQDYQLAFVNNWTSVGIAEGMRNENALENRTHSQPAAPATWIMAGKTIRSLDINHAEGLVAIATDDDVRIHQLGSGELLNILTMPIDGPDLRQAAFGRSENALFDHVGAFSIADQTVLKSISVLRTITLDGHYQADYPSMGAFIDQYGSPQQYSLRFDLDWQSGATKIEISQIVEGTLLASAEVDACIGWGQISEDGMFLLTGQPNLDVQSSRSIPNFHVPDLPVNASLNEVIEAFPHTTWEDTQNSADVYDSFETACTPEAGRRFWRVNSNGTLTELFPGLIGSEARFELDGRLLLNAGSSQSIETTDAFQSVSLPALIDLNSGQVLAFQDQRSYWETSTGEPLGRRLMPVRSDDETIFFLNDTGALGVFSEGVFTASLAPENRPDIQQISLQHAIHQGEAIRLGNGLVAILRRGELEQKLDADRAFASSFYPLEIVDEQTLEVRHRFRAIGVAPSPRPATMSFDREQNQLYIFEGYELIAIANLRLIDFSVTEMRQYVCAWLADDDSLNGPFVTDEATISGLPGLASASGRNPCSVGGWGAELLRSSRDQITQIWDARSANEMGVDRIDATPE